MRSQVGEELGKDAPLEDEDIDAPAIGARRFRPSREGAERWLPAPPALPWWVPNAYILAVIAIGLGMIAFGLMHQDKGDHADLGPAPRAAGPPAQAAAAPSPGPPPVAKQVRPAHHAAKSADLHRVVVLDRFRLGVPSGWTGGTSAGAVVFVAPDHQAELRIYLQHGAAPAKELARRARGFLAGEHPEAKISPTHPLRLGRLEAVGLAAHYPGGVEHAVLFSVGGYSYLILTQVDGGAPRSVRADSGAIVRSFRPV